MRQLRLGIGGGAGREDRTVAIAGGARAEGRRDLKGRGSSRKTGAVGIWGVDGASWKRGELRAKEMGVAAGRERGQITGGGGWSQ